MSTEQQWLDSLTDADKDQLLVDAYFKKSIADTAGAKTIYQLKVEGIFSRWEDVSKDTYDLCMENGDPSRARIVLAAPPAPSVADLESVQQEYYKRGFNEGRAIGRTEAPSVADAAGTKSMVEFYKAARNDGYAEGYKAGVEFMRKNK